MTKMSDVAIPSLLITEGTEPAAPAAGKQRLYIDSTTHKLKRTDSSGVDVTIEATAGAAAGVGAAVRHNANQSIANNTNTQLAFNTEVQDTDAFHDTVTNNSRLTVPSGKAGWYVVSYSLYFASNAGGIRDARLLVNGSSAGGISRIGPAAGGNVTALTGSAILKLAVGDYVQVQVFQDSGGALNVNSDTGLSPEFQMVLVGT